MKTYEPKDEGLAYQWTRSWIPGEWHLPKTEFDALRDAWRRAHSGQDRKSWVPFVTWWRDYYRPSVAQTST